MLIPNWDVILQHHLIVNVNEGLSLSTPVIIFDKKSHVPSDYTQSFGALGSTFFFVGYKPPISPKGC